MMLGALGQGQQLMSPMQALGCGPTQLFDINLNRCVDNACTGNFAVDCANPQCIQQQGADRVPYMCGTAVAQKYFAYPSAAVTPGAAGVAPQPQISGGGLSFGQSVMLISVAGIVLLLLLMRSA